MEKKEKGFDLKRELIAWNWILASFSLFGTIRCLPEFVHVILNDGFVNSYVQNTYVEFFLVFFRFDFDCENF
ncbi:hypothetical protein QR98_0018260 [Sarcoptes scabiei]|uniref:Uncharacterized protein n=1 Tax=Sarcoptes scabiei TaxID=52283 RepID=A0A131ZYL2_SARSC|nr:hypothetical protein QR98_0018260 [Sarcoptes scabiei]